MRTEWVSKRSGPCVTQMHYARKGIVTEEMALRRRSARRSSAELVRSEVARGRLIIPANINHTNLEPMGIGIALSCKVNANIGNQRRHERRREGAARSSQSRLKYGADTVMDLSTGGDIDGIRRAIIARVARADRHGADLPGAPAGEDASASSPPPT